jgi:cytochrome c oxidase subunit 2
MHASVRLKPAHLVVPLAGVVATLVGAAPAAAGNGGLGPVPPESPNAEGISQSYWLITAFVVAIFVLVQGLLIAFLIRYRRRSRARTVDGAQIHGSSRLETIWTVGPVVVLFVIAAFVLAKLPGIDNVPEARAGSERLVVDVVGRQFYWEFRYPNGVVTVDRMRAPEGRTVELRVSAPDEDVIHSWWIPALGGKIDAIPGRVNTTWFEAQRTGVFLGQCAELCGLFHAKMTAAVEVLPPTEFDRWLEDRGEQQTAISSPLGEEVWEGVCAKCHGMEGQGGYGPQLVGSSLVTDAEAMETLIRNGRNLMPAVGSDWTDEQVQAVTDDLQERFGDGS